MSEPLEGEIVNQIAPVQLTKHPEETVKLLEAAFNNAHNITEACQYAGISRETYYSWLEDDIIFADRMAIAGSAINRKAKTNVTDAIRGGDPNISLRYLTLRDPEFKPKAEVTPPTDYQPVEEKIKGFLDDDSGNDVSEQPPTADSTEAGSEVAEAPTDIS